MARETTRVPTCVAFLGQAKVREPAGSNRAWHPIFSKGQTRLTTLPEADPALRQVPFAFTVQLPWHGGCDAYGPLLGREVKMTRGIAHVSFVGGGIFLPARSPYDRQLLAEHVQSRVHAKGQVQVLIDDQRWMVHRRPSSGFAGCSHCGSSINSACYLGAGSGRPYCLTCAFADPTEPARSEPMVERRMSS